MFGESDWDKRDFTFGLAGFLAGVHALRILAERGIASSEDIHVSITGIRATMKSLPDGLLPAAQIAGLDEMLGKLFEAAVVAEARNPRENRDG